MIQQDASAIGASSLPRTAEHDQRALFDGMADNYEAHYADKYSLLYRDNFIHRYLFDGIQLQGNTVLDAACGSGETTQYLVANGAKTTGLDISPAMVSRFQHKFPDCDAVCASVFSTGFDDDSFDCVSIVSGLHHFHPNVQKAIDEAHRILKPGGIFCFCEPPSGAVPDLARKLWYKLDKKIFADNERSIDAQGLIRNNAGRFRPVLQRYGGSVAYLLVLNSLVFRIPAGAKRYYSPFAMFLESLISPLQTRLLSCCVICQWQKVA